MSDEKTVTEREARLRERAAFAEGAHWFVGVGGHRTSPEAEAKNRYPITKRVPQLVPLKRGMTAKVDDDGRLVMRGDHPGAAWIESLDAADTEALRELLANPFEEVAE